MTRQSDIHGWNPGHAGRLVAVDGIQDFIDLEPR